MEVLDDFYNTVCCEITPHYPDPYSFNFDTQHPHENKERFQSNTIKTTKYNVANFFPKAILNQYKRIANLYFLAVAVMSTIPGVTPLNPALIWLPLGVVLVVSLIKEAYEDYQRGKIDKQINSMNKTSVLRGKQLVELPWSDIVVGDVCLIKQDQAFPADLLLLSTNKKDGIAYIQTATLDGQKTSKIRYAFQFLTTTLKTQQDFYDVSGTFNGQIPNQSLDYFRASLSLNNQRYQINDNKQLLFRGAKLKNTEQVWGLAIYTGQCSKLMMNSQISASKITVVEKRLNVLLVSIFVCQIILCVVMTVLSIREETRLFGNVTYLSWGTYHPSGKNFIKNFMMFFIDYSSIIPISLIVSMEIVKLAQSYFVDFDKLMFCKRKDQGTVARNAALNQQLGQISYVFTDKTGTLTTNAMTFQAASIGDEVYQFHIDSDKNYIGKHFSLDCNITRERPLKRAVHLMSADGQASTSIQTQQGLIHHYLLALLCCNAVNTVKKAGEIVYESESPDEIALLKFTKSVGYELVKRENSNIQVLIKGKPLTIKVVQKFSFSSERKRMSVIVQIDGQIMLFLKGADNIVSERIRSHWFTVPQAVQDLSQKGLRTLMVAAKMISTKQYLEFNKAIHEAQLNQRQQIIDRYAGIFESNLQLIGATALLDQLQEGVPQTLRDLHRAHIKVWMLTGDKLETAIEVSKSCSLIEPSFKVIECRSDLRNAISQQMDHWETLIATNINSKYSLVIEGSRLGEILIEEQFSQRFALLSKHFVTVICCRLLPIQKAQVVKLIRSNLNQVCLAIGDGGNDVSMLRQAHIGVGLYGEQGMSAVQASDFAIPEFRMLWRLMFVHGRWNYIRVSEMILYFCYKSLLFTIPRVVFATYNGYSGQPVFDDYYIALYNILFTSLPLLVRALFQQDVNYVLKKVDQENQRQKQPALKKRDSVSEENLGDAWNETQYLPKGFKIDWEVRNLLPRIYFVGKENQILNFSNCILWIAEATLLGVITALISISIVSKWPIDKHGHQADLWMVSITIYSIIIILNNVKITMHVRHWTGLFIFSVVVCSLAPYLIYVWISNYTLAKYVHGTVVMSFRNPATYLVVTFITIFCIMIVSLVIYAMFHTNKMVKKLRLKMLQITDASEIRSQSSKGDKMRSQQLVGQLGLQRGVRIKISSKLKKQTNQTF